MWSSTFCIRVRLSPFPACLPAPLGPAWEAHGASGETGTRPEERLRTAFWEEASRHRLEKTKLELRPGLAPGQRVWGEHQMDLQLGWVRAAEEEWHTVELWDGSPCLGADCPGADSRSRSRLSQPQRWVPWAGVSWRVKVQSWPLSTQKHQSIIHFVAKSWDLCPEEHLGMAVSPSPVQECASTARGSCLPPVWNIILKGQGGPSRGTSATQNWI